MSLSAKELRMGLKAGACAALKQSTTVVTLKGNPKLLGKTFSLDLSTVIHRCLHIQGVSDEFHMDPPVPLNQFIREFKKCMTMLYSIPIQVECCLDGGRNLLKRETDDSRSLPRADKEVRLKMLLKRSDLSEEERNELNKLKGACVYVREDVLLSVYRTMHENKWRFSCAVMEADHWVGVDQPRLYYYIKLES